MKLCPDCGRHLPAEAFSKNAKNGDGLYSYCKECARLRKEAYRSDPEKRRLEQSSNLRRYEQNSAASNAISRAYHHTNRERRIQQMRDIIDRIDDSYVLKILRRATGLNNEQIPASLVEAKRAHIRVLRTIKKEVER